MATLLPDRQEGDGAVDGATSKISDVISLAQQESVLGPLLFITYISNIYEHVQYSSVATFADDTRVLKEVTSESDVDILQLSQQCTCGQDAIIDPLKIIIHLNI